MKINLILFVLLSFISLKAQVAVISANDSTLCFGEQIQLSSTLSDAGNSHIVYTVWKFEGNGLLIEDTLSFGTNFTLSNINPGIYDVSIINIHQDLSQSSISLNQFIQVFPNPVADFDTYLPYQTLNAPYFFDCPPVIPSFFDASSSDTPIITWNWYLNTNPNGLPFDSISYTEPNTPPVWYNFPGDYDFILEVVNAVGCRDTFISPYQLHIAGPSIDFDITQKTTFCGQDFQLDLSNATNVSSFSWNINNNFAYNGTFTNDTILSAHIQDVGYLESILSFKDYAGCTAYYYDTIFVAPNGLNAEFNVNQNYTTTVDTIHFNDISNSIASDIQYRIWDFGDGNIDTLVSETNLSHLYTSPNIYTSFLKIVDTKGCSNRFFQTIEIISSTNTFPNPASQVLNFYHIDYLRIANLYVLDFNGTEILTIPLLNNPQTIDISSLSDGMYFLKYWLNNDWVFEQFMVQN